jgi:hypothetical protein
MVSAPASNCLGAEIRLTANYYDVNSVFVCGGTIMVAQKDLIQNTYFEFRPMVLDYFAKWRDGPSWEQSNFHRLVCLDRNGIEIRDHESRSTTLRLFASVFPKKGGLATSELTVTLPRPLPTRRF